MVRAALLPLAAVFLVLVAESSAVRSPWGPINTIITPRPKIRLVRDVTAEQVPDDSERLDTSSSLDDASLDLDATDIPSVDTTEDTTLPNDDQSPTPSESRPLRRNVRSIFPDPTFPFPPRPTFPEPNPFPLPKGPYPTYLRERRSILWPRPRPILVGHTDIARKGNTSRN